MIFDHRTYTCRPNTMRLQLELYDRYGREAQLDNLGGEPLFYGETTDTGLIFSFVHIWVYDTMGERAERRASLNADPRWAAFRNQMREHQYLIAQENRILRPAPFFAAARKEAGTGEQRKVVFEHCTDTCFPDTVADELAIYAETGHGPEVSHLGEPLLFGYSEAGKIDSYTRIWVFDSQQDLEDKRAALAADEAWNDYRRRSREARNRQSRETRIMTPAPFFRF